MSIALRGHRRTKEVEDGMNRVGECVKKVDLGEAPLEKLKIPKNEGNGLNIPQSSFETQSFRKYLVPTTGEKTSF